jgi:hypothetical protein
MARQRLGQKKTKRLESKLGMKIAIAHVNSVWGRHWAEAWVNAKDSFLINMRTGDFTQLTASGKPIETKPLWRKVGCCA